MTHQANQFRAIFGPKWRQIIQNMQLLGQKPTGQRKTTCTYNTSSFEENKFWHQLKSPFWKVLFLITSCYFIMNYSAHQTFFEIQFIMCWFSCQVDEFGYHKSNGPTKERPPVKCSDNVCQSQCLPTVPRHNFIHDNKTQINSIIRHAKLSLIENFPWTHILVFFLSLTLFCLCPLSLIPWKTLIGGSH